MDIKDIIESWVKTVKPSKKELELANTRMTICNECPSNVEGLGGMRVCGECQCPIIFNDKPIGKLYTKKQTCPKKKW